jgi:amino acid adenylation domain-containing protein/non-ribosomal peptide synthase protein (TIGR01720 family)
MKNFIKELLAKDIHLVSQDGNLKVKHNGNLTEEIKVSIRENKEEILQFLNAYNAKTTFENISKIEAQESYELSSSQYRIWVLSQFEGASEAYNMFNSFPVEIEEVEIFKKAIYAVVDRHEILRTVYKKDANNQVRQWVKDRATLGFVITEHDFTKSNNASEEVVKFIKEDAFKAFDLEHGPLLRVFLLKTSATNYMFYYNMHHIMSDGWSMNILFRDVAAYYEALNKNAVVELPELKIQYKDYAAWQLNYLKSDVYKEQEAFWKSELSGELPILKLPSKGARPKALGNNGYHLATYISPDKAIAFKKYCKEKKGSLFMGLLAVWNVLLYKYTNQKDIIIGIPVSGREHTDLKDQIGSYVNTLALRNQLNPNDSFNALFEKVKNRALSCFKHQMFPFDKLVEALNIEKDPSRNAIYDVLITMQGADKTRDVVSPSQIDYASIEDVGKGISKLDLDIDFEEYGDAISFKVTYDADIYAKEMIMRMMLQYRELISAIIDNPEEELQYLNYLTEDQRQKLIVDFNTTEPKEENDNTYIQLFKQQVQKTPNQKALVFDDKVLSYKELDDLSDEFAFFLQDKSAIEINDKVAIQLHRNDWLIVALLGILKSGACYVPIDPNYPKDRIEFIQKDSACKFIIDSKFIESFEEPHNVVSNIENLYIDHTNETSAYIIYTSGSTGKPKGVEISHAAFVDYVTTFKSYFKLTTEDTVIHQASISFDTSVEEIFPVLISGGTLVIASNDQKDIDGLLKLCEEHKVTVFSTNPPTLQYLNSIYTKNTYNFRILISGGDVLKANQIDTLFDKVNVYNTYGPTESTVCATYHQINKLHANLPIGKPIPNREVYILERNSENLVSEGVVGEICIAGKGIANGYVNRPELTKEKFIQHPFKENQRLYRTGDLGKWLSDGTIAFIGRKDDQVKIKGYRIELGEIEYIIAQKETIKNVVVLVEKSETSTKQLVAYIVSDTKEETEDLRTFIAASLPEYMIPNFFVQIDEIPQTINGKVDKVALQKLKGNTIKEDNYVAPRTLEEEILAEVWKKILKVPEISVKAKFFTLGGDSIKAIQVVSKLKKEGYGLSVKQILQYPILEDLALHVTSSIKTSDQEAVNGIVALSPIQEDFFNDKTIKNRNHFNHSVVLKSKSAIDAEVLQKTINALVKHHDVLRMVYKETKDGKWEQINLNAETNFDQISFQDLRELDDELEAMKKYGATLQSSFNIQTGPLLKIGHYRMSDGDHLVFIAHHLIIDGVSWRILLEDFSNVYEQIAVNDKVELPLKTDSYKHWSTTIKNYAKSAEIAKELPYWETITQKQIEKIPTDFKTDEEYDIQYNKYCSFEISEVNTNLLQTEVHKAYNTEINDVLLTSLGLAIQEVFGINQTVLTMEGHGRDEIIEGVDVSRTMGWFTSVYPTVIDVTNTSSNTEALINIKESLRRIPNKGVGYGILKHNSKDFKQISEASLIFNYLGDFGSNASNKEASIFDFSSETIGHNSDAQNTNEALLNVYGILSSGKLRMYIDFDDSLFKTETIQQLSDAYEKQLKALIEATSAQEAQVTPSDLTYKGLSAKQLAEINKDNTVEDVYELAPLQHGIYYHALQDAINAVYFEQTAYRIHYDNGNIDMFCKAFNALVEKYAVLRTSFTNAYGETPLQIVHKKVESDFSSEVLNKEAVKDIEAYVEQKKIEDRNKGFNLEIPQLIRLTVLELGNNKFEFIWSFHHILMDGWCVGILISDYYKFLKAFEQNKEATFEKSTPYSEYIKWLRTVDTNDTLEFWQKNLSNYENNAILPFQKNKATLKKTSKEVVEKHMEIHLKDEVFNHINTLCTTLGITMNTFIQGVWGYLLSRYNNVEDVVFGAVVSGRPGELTMVDRIVGLFINTIPVRVAYTNDDTPQQLLKRIHQEGIEASSHHYISLSDVQMQSELGKELINHFIAFENYPLEEFLSEGNEQTSGNQKNELTIEAVDNFEQTNYDFNIMAVPSKNALRIQFTYNEAAFDTELIQKIPEHFQNVVHEFVSDETQSLGNISYLTKSEETQILEEFNATKISYPSEKTIITLFKEQVQETPNNIALIFENTEMTYKELDKSSNELANYIKQQYTINTGDSVGVLLERDEWSIISMLAILKLSAVYVPIDTNYPEERISYIQENSNCIFTINTDFITTYKNTKAKNASLEVDVTTTADDLAYIMYTSGSTGKPKGVMAVQKGIVRLVKNTNYVKVKAGDRILSLSSFSFDGATYDIFMALLNGATVVVTTKNDFLDYKKLNQILLDNQINGFFITTALFNTLVDQKLSALPTLDYILFGGERVSNLHVEEFMKMCPEVTLTHVYGPTENTTFSTYYTIKEITQNDVPIGTSIANSTAYILNSSKQLQTVGVVGEIYLGGDGLAKGYLNDTALTESKFITSPFNKNERIYKTGDLGKLLPGGYIEFIGRNDGQVKIRGFRIELGEIEDALLNMEFITSTIVIAITKDSKEKSLVAYITAEKEVMVEEIRKELADQFPHYMVPSSFIQLEKLPLNINGKVDRKALPIPNDINALSTTAYVAPTNEIEEELVAIWEEILERKGIGIQDNFYELGGHSLKVIKVISTIQEKYAIKIPVEKMLISPTIEAIALEIENVKWSEHVSENASTKKIIL